MNVKFKRSNLLVIISLMLFSTGSFSATVFEEVNSSTWEAPTQLELDITNVRLGAYRDQHVGWNVNSFEGSGLLFNNNAKGDFDYYNMMFPSTDLSYRLNTGGDSYSMFTNDLDKILFGESECKTTCDEKMPFCGWVGVSTEAELDARLAKCNMTRSELPLQAKTRDDNVAGGCTTGLVLKSSGSDLDSIAQIIGYDCNALREGESDDAKFCGCVLKKANNPRERLFTPLSTTEKSLIAAMTHFDDFHKKTAQIQRGLFEASRVLTDAFYHPTLHKLFEGENNPAKACLPGSFKAIGYNFLQAKQDDGKLNCGEQGTHRLNQFLKKSVETCDSATGCSSAWPNFAASNEKLSSATAESPYTVFDFVQDQSIAYHEQTYQPPKEVTEGMHAGEDMLMSISGFCNRVANNAVEYAQTAAQGAAARAQCDSEPQQTVPLNRSYLESLVSKISEYRANKDQFPGGIDQYVAFQMENGAADELGRIEREISNKYPILKHGVFKNHAYAASPFGKMLQMVNESIPEDLDLNSNTKNLRAVADALEGDMDNIQEKIVREAMAGCSNSLRMMATSCKKMDKPNSDLGDLSYDEMSHFSPADAVKRFHGDKGKLGSIHPIHPENLKRKFELYRCGNMMADSNLNAMAFQGVPGIKPIMDPKIFAGVFAEVDDASKEAGTASSVGGEGSESEGNLNIYAKSDKDRAAMLASSGDSDLVELGKVLTSGRGSGSRFSQSVSELTGVSNDTLVAADPEFSASGVEYSDTSSTMKDIAGMAGDAFSGNDTQSSSSDINMGNSTYAKSLSNYNEKKLADEKIAVEKEKAGADSRLDVIAERLAGLIKKQEANKANTKKKEDELKTDEERKQDPAYQSMLIEKLRLEKEIASLGVEKRKKLAIQKEADEKLQAIEAAKEEKKAIASAGANGPAATGTPAKKLVKKGGGGSNKISKNRAGGGGNFTSGGGGGSSFSGSSPQSSAEGAPYVITLSEDQRVAIEQNFQVVKKPSSWVAGVKPPVIRDGNIYYELAVKDGKIMVDELGNPIKKKALNGFQIIGLRQPASTMEELPKEVDKKEVVRRRAVTVEELNALLNKSR